MESATYTDAELLLMLKAKDWKAFDYLYEHYSGGLYSSILQMLPERELANQALLETFVYVMRYAAQHDIAKSSLFTWMMHAARHFALDILKSGAQRQQPDDTASPGIAPVEHGLKKALQQLSPENRNIFELVYFKGHSYDEVAAATGLTVTGVKQQLRKALIQLREIVK